MQPSSQKYVQPFERESSFELQTKSIHKTGREAGQKGPPVHHSSFITNTSLFQSYRWPLLSSGWVGAGEKHNLHSQSLLPLETWERLQWGGKEESLTFGLWATQHNPCPCPNMTLADHSNIRFSSQHLDQRRWHNERGGETHHTPPAPASCSLHGVGGCATQHKDMPVRRGNASLDLWSRQDRELLLCWQKKHREPSTCLFCFMSSFI